MIRLNLPSAPLSKPGTPVQPRRLPETLFLTGPRAGDSKREERAAPVPVTGRPGTRVPVCSVRAGGVHPDGLQAGGTCPSPGGSPWLPGRLSGVQRQDRAPLWVMPSPWSSGAWPAARRPFQQPRGLPAHSHPSLRLLEFMNSPRRHKSRWEPLSVLSSRQQTAEQGLPCPHATGGPRLPEALLQV